jgi:hypothetical protein
MSNSNDYTSMMPINKINNNNIIDTSVPDAPAERFLGITDEVGDMLQVETMIEEGKVHSAGDIRAQLSGHYFDMAHETVRNVMTRKSRFGIMGWTSAGMRSIELYRARSGKVYELHNWMSDRLDIYPFLPCDMAYGKVDFEYTGGHENESRYCPFDLESQTTEEMLLDYLPQPVSLGRQVSEFGVGKRCPPMSLGRQVSEAPPMSLGESNSWGRRDTFIPNEPNGRQVSVADISRPLSVKLENSCLSLESEPPILFRPVSSTIDVESPETGIPKPDLTRTTTVTPVEGAGSVWPFYKDMDANNKKAADVLFSKGPAAAIEYMMTDENGNKLSYAEARARYG